MTEDIRIDRWIVQPSLNRIRPAAREADSTEPRQLGHKVMAVLLMLAERPGELVTKEEIFERVWEGAFTTDEALATVVYELRKALDDEARRPRYIETIRKRGYRLIAPVSAPLEPSSTESAATNPSAQTPAARERGRRRWAMWAWPALAGAASATLAVTTLLPGPRSAILPELALAPDISTSETRSIRSLAVRPLTSITEECRQDFFAGGLTEMLIADLVYADTLDIIPTPDVSSSMLLQDGQVHDPRADAILEGTVLRSGDRLWISIQLVDSLGGQILWGGTYERELHDSLNLQLELSREISSQIVSSVTPEEDQPADGSS